VAGVVCDDGSYTPTYSSTSDYGYTTTTASYGNDCGGEIHASYGQIRSPNYPDNYPNNARCEWIVYVPGYENNTRITLTIDYLHLEECCDTLRIYNYEDPYSSREYTYTGNLTDVTVNIPWSPFVVEFTSDYSVTYDGFTATFRLDDYGYTTTTASYGNGTDLLQDWRYGDYNHVCLTYKETAYFYSQGYQDYRIRDYGCDEVYYQHGGCPQYPQPPPTGSQQFIKATRREYRCMTRDERSDFHHALNMLKYNIINVAGESEYDVYAKHHRNVESPSAHAGAAFLPWHREYLHRLESALRQKVSSAYLPYWDTMLDERLPNPKDSVMWLDTMMGNNYGPVTSGPAANWGVISECAWSSTLRRSVNNGGNSMLFTDAKINQIMSQYTADNAFWLFESHHNNVHSYVGGHMGSLTCAPNDPMFWLHHAYIDYLWETWRKTVQTTDPELDYPSGASAGHTANDPMKPFQPLINQHGLSDHYTNLYYEYEERPSNVVCSRDCTCCSDFLWCDTTVHRCVSKVREGGDCTGLPDNACYCEDENAEPVCIRNICGCIHWYT
jgi:hypothetical protein